MSEITDEQPEDNVKIKECLQQQLVDMETLQSIYMEPGEFEISDHGVLADANDFVQSLTDIVPNRLDFTLNLNNNGFKTEINFNLPNTFPHSKPDVYVKCSKLARTESSSLNEELKAHINENMEPYCLFSIIDWIKDSVDKYVCSSSVEVKSKIQKPIKEIKYCRYWIYSHHIYNKLKRKEIQNLAHELNLTGFSLPGKPGVVCIEGDERNCEEWWSNIKSMNWQKINVINREILENETDRYFKDFKEKIFQKGVVKSNDKHMDMGEFYKFLENNNCGYMFKYYFGFDGKCDK